MFITAQIPFVDMRLLSKARNSHCFFPNTFNRHYEKATYYRFLGSEKSRYGASGLPVAERTFFDSRKLLYITNIENGFRELMRYDYFPRLLFARFFEEKQSFHFDIGLRDGCGSQGNTRKNIRSFSKFILETPFFGINDRYEAARKKYSILGLEEALRDIYLYATSSKKISNEENDRVKIIFGYPALFIIYDRKEQHFFGKAKAFYVCDHIDVRHELIAVGHTFADIWYIGKESLGKHDQDLRYLRIYLSKLHNKKESTRIMLDYSERCGDESLDINKFTSFLNYIWQQLNRDYYYSFENKNFEDLAFYLDESYNEVTWKEFKNRIRSKLEGISMNKGNNYVHQSIYGSNVVTFAGSSSNQTGDIVFHGRPEEDLSRYLGEFEKIKEELDGVLKNSLNHIPDKEINFSKVTEDFLVCAKSKAPERSKLKETYENLKIALKKIGSYVVSNPDKTDKLVSLGQKIFNLLSENMGG